jgi:hypothetical protein
MKLLREHLADVMGVVGYVQKDGKNQAQSYTYASAEAVLKKVNAELSIRGIAVASVATLEHFNVNHYATQGKTRDGSDFTKQNFRSDAVVKLALTFSKDIVTVDEKTNTTSITREDVTVQGIGASTDLGDKAVMKANTAAIKYCLTNAFLISWGDDPEGDAAGNTPTTPKASKPKAKKTTTATKKAATGGLKKAEKF